MSQNEVVSRLAETHLTCPTCKSAPGVACVVMKRPGLFGRIAAGLPRAVPHQARRDPFIEAWSDGYITAEADSIRAHR